MRRALVPLALVGTLALAACGSGSTTTSDSPASSTPSTPTEPAATETSPGTAETPSETSSETPSAPAPTATGSASAPADEPSDSPTAPEDPGAPTGAPAVHTYRHLKVTLPVADDAVPDAPQGLTAYLRTTLQKDWRSLGRTPDCRRSPTMIVQASRSDGFAYGSHEINVTPSGGCEKAATMGGGYRAVWKDVGGTWKEVLAMQDVPDCAEFERWAVPSAILGKDAQCYDGKDVVHYSHE